MRAAVNNVWLGSAIATVLACSFDAGGGSGASVGLGGTTEVSGASIGSTKPTASDDQGPDSDPDDSSGGDLETGPPLEACDGGGVCVPLVPDGWSGPVVFGAWTPDMTALACPQDWTINATGGNQLDAPMPSCGCTCMPTQGSCAINYTYYDDPNCENGAFSGAVGPACMAEVHYGRDSVIAVAAPQGSACTPTPTANVPAPVWGENAIACAPAASLGDCEGGVCMPDPPFGDYCVSAPGDQSCPAGPFIARRLIYRNVADTRACTPCECGLTAGCGGGLQEYETGLCGLQDGAPIPANGTCQSSNVEGNPTFGVAYEGPAPQVACAASSSVPMGSASAGDPITFCCT